jgi:hypothetical protein
MYFWHDNGLVIEAETCCHLVNLNKINIHNILSCVLTCKSLLFICILNLLIQHLFFGSHNSEQAVRQQCFHTTVRERSRHLPSSDCCTYVIRQDSTLFGIWFGIPDMHWRFSKNLWTPQHSINWAKILFIHLIFMDPCIVNDLLEIPTSCSFVVEFIIPNFFESSTCFERHTAHHQEL